jgi:hypothetical protein
MFKTPERKEFPSRQDGISLTTDPLSLTQESFNGQPKKAIPGKN